MKDGAYEDGRVRTCNVVLFLDPGPLTSATVASLRRDQLARVTARHLWEDVRRRVNIGVAVVNERENAGSFGERHRHQYLPQYTLA